MRLSLSHSWDLSTREARDLQLQLREQLLMEAPRDLVAARVAGADLSMARRSKRGFGGFVVLEGSSLDVVDRSAVEVPLNFPYVPGLLSFRELPVLVKAWERLNTRPDVLVFDGHGYAHPRRFGLACHGGMVFGVPSIGCAKSILIGTHGDLGSERGSTAPLVDDDEVIGMAVRTRDRVTPVYVSVGHRMDLETAVRIVLDLCPRYREPETTRAAHRMVNDLRTAAHDQQ
jgi:deoxyribonuclease V